MRIRSTAARWAIVLLTPLAVAGSVVAIGDATSGDGAVVPPLGPGDVTVRIDVSHSTFEPDELTVVEGTRVRFLVVNGDPINHELITGDPEVHVRHARGTEAEHPSIPGEVSVGPDEMAITTFTFEEAGSFEFACHLPGHYEYGMHGTIEVVPPRA